MDKLESEDQKQPAVSTKPHDAQMTLEQLHVELRKHGLSSDKANNVIASVPAYEGHRQCVKCKAFHADQVTEALYYCDKCGDCRHAVRLSSVCRDCGLVDPPHVELTEEHFQVHFLDSEGKVLRTVRR